MAAAQAVVLSERDRAILADLLRVRLLTGRQLERLHFTELATPNAQASARRRSLGRLSSLKLVTTLPRRVGGERAGSAGLVYALDVRAHRLRSYWMENDVETAERIRRPWAIGWMFVQHTLDVSELYVRLRDVERARREPLLIYEAEPASWYRTAKGVLKPDAYAVFERGAWEEHLWIEVDRSTESLPTLRRKFTAYLDAADSGVHGPHHVMPRVLVTVPYQRRQTNVQQLIDGLHGGHNLISVVPFETAFTTPRPPP